MIEDISKLNKIQMGKKEVTKKKKCQIQSKHKADEWGFIYCEKECPQCGSDDLDREDLELADELLILTVYCNTCGCSAEEYYYLKYEHTELNEYGSEQFGQSV